MIISFPKRNVPGMSATFATVAFLSWSDVTVI